MLRTISWLRPTWLASAYPLLQYELSAAQRQRRRFAWQFCLLTLLLAGAAWFYGALVPDPAANSVERLWQSLYYPLLLLQGLTLLGAFMLGAASVPGQRRHKTWDTLRATESGAALALRARWLAILYRLRAPIAALLLARLIFAAGLLSELTAFGGLYAQLLAERAQPPLADWRLALPLIALNLSLNFLLPLLLPATAAALGILLSVALKERIYLTTAQILFVAAALTLLPSAAIAVNQMLSYAGSQFDSVTFALFLAYSGGGDWGLLLMQLGSVGELWQRLPGGIYLGFGLSLQVVLQAAATDGMLGLAARLAESRG